MAIGLKILAPYLLNPLLKRSLAIHVPTKFIHLENGIYLMALLDGEFEWTARRLHPHGGIEQNPYRRGARLIHHLEKNIDHFLTKVIPKVKRSFFLWGAGE